MVPLASGVVAEDSWVSDSLIYHNHGKSLLDKEEKRVDKSFGSYQVVVEWWVPLGPIPGTLVFDVDSKKGPGPLDLGG